MVQLEVEDLTFAAFGGVLIGLATSLNLLTYGRITGNSSVFNTLIKVSLKDGFKWKFSFFAGLIFITTILFLTTDDQGGWENGKFRLTLFDPYDQNIGGLHVVGWIIGGFLVGFGTRMGNGCTSGHGVCGIPRLSIRSVVAVLAFMGWGIAMATFRHYVPFLEQTQSFGDNFEDAWDITGPVLAGVAFIVYLAIAIFIHIKSDNLASRLEMPISFLVGVIFGLGLAFGGMCRRTKIINFLTMYEDWDPSLILVMVGAIAVNLITFYYIIKVKKTPTFAPKLWLPENKKLDIKLISGASIFGLGWGLSGLCPGPGMVLFFNTTHAAFIWIPSLAVGQICSDLLNKLFQKKEKLDADKPVNK